MHSKLLLAFLITISSAQAQPLAGHIEGNQLYGDETYTQLNTQISATMPPIAPSRLLYPLYLQNASGKLKPNNLQADHGQAPIGVIGAELVAKNWSSREVTIKILYPQSDLNHFDVHPGDRIVAVDNESFSGLTDFRNRSRGMPGTTVELTIWGRGDGFSKTITVKRIDARTLPQNDSYFNWAASQTRYW
jgi:hypothetical protein